MTREMKVGFGAWKEKMARRKAGKLDKPTYEAKGAKSIKIEKKDDIKKVMKIIEATRTAKGHALNHRSSRSHCILTLTLTKK